MKLPEQKFPVICADNPWEFKTRSAKGLAGRPQHYKRMTLEEICAIPVKDMAAKDCHLFFWTTAPHLDQSFAVLKAWGFKYSSVAFVWIKLKKNAAFLQPGRLADWDLNGTYAGKPHFSEDALFMGQGYTTRKNAEYCLLARRGKPKRLRKDILDVIIAPVREHSRKPEEFYERVGRYAKGPYFELFSRQERPGWTVFGDETDKFKEAA